MIEEEFIIKNSLGLHARPVNELVKRLSKYKSTVKIFKNDEVADGKSILEILILAVNKGEKIKVIVDGEDEKEVIEVIRELVENKFYTEPL